MIVHPELRRNIPETPKERLFRIMHFIVEEYSISPYMYIFMVCLETLQMIYLALHPSCCLIWSTPFIYVLQKILGYLSCALAWENSSEAILAVFSGILFLLYGLTMGIIIYEVKYPKSRIETNMQEFRIKFIQNLSVLSRTILVLPIITLVSTNIQNSFSNESSIQTLATVFSIAGVIMSILVTYLLVDLHVDSSPFSKLPWAGSINYNEKYKILLKVLISISLSILPSECSQNFTNIHFGFIIVVISILIFLLCLQILEPNMVNNLCANAFEHSLVFLLAVYFVSFYYMLLKPKDNISLLFSFLFCLIISFTWRILKNEREKFLFCSAYKSLSSKKEILSYIYLLCQYVRDFPENPLCLIKLQGILSDHVLNCKKLDEVCPCRTFKEKIKYYTYEKNQEEIEEETIGWFQFIKASITLSTEKISNLPEFNILLSYFEKSILKNNFVSYSNLERCLSKKTNLPVEFMIYNQKRIIEKTMFEEDINKNERKQVDANKFLSMTFLFGKLHEKILKSSLEHLDFWKALSNKKKKSVIMREGSKLLKTVRECEKLNNQIIEKYPNNLDSLVLFSNYSKYILNNNDLIRKNKVLFNTIKKKIFRPVKISSEQEKEKYSENSITGAIVISGQKLNVGTVKYCSSKVFQVLKYPDYELIGQNINTLMPNFIGNMHNEVLYKYLEQAEPSSDFAERYAPMIDRDNFMVLGRMMTKPIPSLLNGLELIGLLEKVKEYHIRHYQEIPKYLLYRCDTGKIEALSESFYTQYGYRLMKLNEYSETSEELTFESLFVDVHDRDIINKEEGFECQLKVKKGPKSIIKVKVYIRYEIMYFGVKVKLLQIFNCIENNLESLLAQNGIPSNPHQALMEDRSDMMENHIEVPNLIDPLLNLTQSKNLTSEDEIKEIKNKQPLKLKIFKVIVGVSVLLSIIMSSVQFYFDTFQVNLMKNFQEHHKYSSNSLLHLIGIGYWTRIIQLSSHYPNDLPDFTEYKKNISILTESLQAAEFWLANKAASNPNSLQINFNDSTLLWQLNEKGEVYSTPNTLSLNIFDFVTSSSAFTAVDQSELQFGFKLGLETSTNANNSLFRKLFNIRYSSLFELISAKTKYAITIKEAYTNKFEAFLSFSKIELALSCVLLIITLIMSIKILYMLLQNIFSISILFNWLTPNEIYIEMENCENFLKYFFNNNYEVVLKINNKNEEKEIEENNNIQNIYYHPSEDNIMQDEHIEQIKLEQNFENTEDKFNQNHQNNAEEATPLREEESNSAEFEDTEEEPIIFNCRTFCPIFIALLICLINSIALYFHNEEVYMRSSRQIENQDIIFSNIETLDSLKYYGLETALDNTIFEKYPSLPSYFSSTKDLIYEKQENLYEFSEVSNFQYETQRYLYNANIEGVCSNFISVKEYPLESFSKEECKQIEKGVLNEGLRASIVAYIESISSWIDINSSEELVKSASFKSVTKLDKYLKSALAGAINANANKTNENLTVEFRIRIAWFCLIIPLMIIIGFMAAKIISNDIMTRIEGTSQIISLIPKRIFKKNSTLTTEYSKNVQKLMS